MVKSLGHNHLLINAKNKYIKQEDKLEYTILSNGFIVSNHFYQFYKYLAGNTIFDGYSFILGDWSDAFISDIHRETLIQGDLCMVMNSYMRGLEKNYLSQCIEYISETYNFLKVNTKEALIYTQGYSFSYICSKVLAGVLLPATYFNINNYSFFLSKYFFAPVLRRNEGIASSFKGRNDYPGYIKGKKILSHIASKTGSRALNINMDKGLSLKDIYRDNTMSYLKMKIHQKKRAFYNKYLCSSSKINPFNSKDSIEMKYPSFVRDENMISPYLRVQIELINNVEESFDKLKSTLNI